jgi:hypothetical protein
MLCIQTKWRESSRGVCRPLFYAGFRRQGNQSTAFGGLKNTRGWVRIIEDALVFSLLAVNKFRCPGCGGADLSVWQIYSGRASITNAIGG